MTKDDFQPPNSGYLGSISSSVCTKKKKKKKIVRKDQGDYVSVKIIDFQDHNYLPLTDGIFN